MKIIQWYPGHMAKAMRMMEEQLSLVDAVVFVLDARAPAASFNPKLRAMAGAKPVLYLFNKGDLADGKVDAICTRLRESGKPALKIAANSQGASRALTREMTALVSEKIARNQAKGVVKPLRFLVAGVPNTGKSTLINLLSGSKKAITGDKAGVTRQKQWVKCGAFELLDTPGAMPPSCENQTLARRLAYVGSINDDILDIEEVALCLIEELHEKYPALLAARYGVTEGTPLELYEEICRKRGFLSRGGEVDYERGAKAVLDDFRKGRLGQVCLDSVLDGEIAGLF